MYAKHFAAQIEVLTGWSVTMVMGGPNPLNGNKLALGQ